MSHPQPLNLFQNLPILYHQIMMVLNSTRYPHELSEALDPKDLTVDSDDIGETQQDVPIIENNSLENTVNEPDWEGTVLELEEMFVTVLNDGIDTIIKRQSGSPFTGRMRIIKRKRLY